MSEETKEDLKEGEDKTPAGDDQPDKKDADSPEEDSSEDEEVKISKSELEKLRKDADEKENYRKAVIRLNQKNGRKLPGLELEKKPKSDNDDDDDDDESKGDFVTKQELVNRDEKQAVDKACENEEIALNWDEIVVFYIPSKDNSYNTKLAGILKAHKLWRLDKGLTDKPKEQDGGKKATKALVEEKGSAKGKDKKSAEKKKSIIPKKEKMEGWYN